MGRYSVVVVGTSWGGLHAVGIVLDSIPADFPLPIVIAQHRSPSSPGGALTRLLQQHVALEVREADDKDLIEPGHVFLAPPDYHLLLEDGRFALSTDEQVQYSRPSIDVLFESAADAYAEAVVGVILTGANRDGAAGLARIKKRRGFTVVQEPATAERRAMPDAAIATGAVDKVLPIHEIGPFLVELCTRPALRTRPGGSHP
jgi:two-component system chemotaxis response regulator CheB